MKKKWVSFLTLSALFLGTTTMAVAESPMEILINGKPLSIDGSLQNVNGRIWAPVRTLAEALGAQVTWNSEKHAVEIVTSQSSEENRLALLEHALAPKDPLTAVTRWADGVKERNGALQYAVLSPALRKAYGSDFESLHWVTGTSSPWVKEYQIAEKGKLDSNTYLYEVSFTWTDSTGSTSTENEQLTVKNFDGIWLISAIGKTDVRGTITQIEWNHEHKITSILVEGQKEKDTTYDKAKAIIDDQTKIYKASTGEPVSELQKQMRVEVKMSGPVNYSYPVIGKAKEIVVLE